MQTGHGYFWTPVATHEVATSAIRTCHFHSHARPINMCETYICWLIETSDDKCITCLGRLALVKGCHGTTVQHLSGSQLKNFEDLPKCCQKCTLSACTPMIYLTSTNPSTLGTYTPKKTKSSSFDGSNEGLCTHMHASKSQCMQSWWMGGHLQGWRGFANLESFVACACEEAPRVSTTKCLKLTTQKIV